MRIRTSVALCALGAMTAIGLGSATAHAGGPLPQEADRIDAPGRSIVTDDTMEALRLNPANIAFTPSWELRLTGVYCKDLQKTNCGHAFDMGTPLFAGLSVGFRVDYVTPPDAAPSPFSGNSYVWTTYGLAWHVGKVFAVGVTYEHSYSSTGLFDSLNGLTVGGSFRPNRFIALSGVARDFNNPNSAYLNTTNTPLLERAYIGGVVVRPYGRRPLELGFEAKWLDSSSQFLPRFTGALDIPGVGRLRSDVEVSHWISDSRRGVVGTIGLELALEKFTLGGGALFGRGLGANSSVGEYLSASIGGYSEPGIPLPNRAVKIRIEHTPGTRGHVALLEKIWKLSNDHETSAIILDLKDSAASGLAHAEEIADAFRYAHAKGKKVICTFEDGNAATVYACAGADRILVSPAGGVRYAGLKSQHLYIADLLSKIGVKGEFVRISEHKSAPEMFTQTGPSDTARADYADFLTQVESVFVRNESIYRHIPEERIREVTKKGPFVAEEARSAGFVDGVAYDDEIERVTTEVVGGRVRMVDWADDQTVSDTFGLRGHIGLLYIDGDIVDGRSQHVPFLDERLAGSYTMQENIERLKDDPTVTAVVLRIESPGGSTLASDVMWHSLEKLAEVKPLIVSMGAIAASGGYYVAAPAKRIFAMPLTLTGSIGVYYGKFDLSGLLSKIGVNVDTLKTTPRADAESLYRGFSDDERKELGHKIEQWYDVFLDRVARGRHMTKAQVDAVARGRVWTGQEAMANGLVDEMGGLRQALNAARVMGNLPDDAPIAEYPPVDTSLLETALHLAGIGGASETVLPAGTVIPTQIKAVLKAIAPLASMKDQAPMSRLEWVDTEEAPTGD